MSSAGNIRRVERSEFPTRDAVFGRVSPYGIHPFHLVSDPSSCCDQLQLLASCSESWPMQKAFTGGLRSEELTNVKHNSAFVSDIYIDITITTPRVATCKI